VLNFFTKKIPLTKIFPTDFVDIHSHFLPGIDDGAKNIEEAIELLTKMTSYGITNFITTPHVIGKVWNNSSDTILQKLETLREELEKRDLSYININAAAEYMLDNNFSKLLKDRDLLTLNKDFLLIEMSYFFPPINLFELIFDIQLAGYRPILAHPERYAFYYNNFDMYEKLQKAGCRFQLNLLSLTGYYGKSVKKITEKLLEKNMIDFVGSDIHHEKHLNALKELGTKKNIRLLDPILKNNIKFL